MAKNYDLVLLGGGTGGYVAAIRCAQLGLRAAIVEQDKLGGTCLHRGCIPTKALLRSAEVYRTLRNSRSYGVEVPAATLNFAAVQQRKQHIVDRLHRGILQLMKKRKIDVYRGRGRLLGSMQIACDTGTGSETLAGKHLMIATGSRPRSLNGLEPDGECVMTSDDALRMTAVPSSILIVGGGAIGAEWASMLADFGTKVTILEYTDRLVPTEDSDVSASMARSFRRRGINVVTGAKVLPATLKKNGGVTIDAALAAGRRSFSAERLLISVGRQPNSEDIGLENTSIVTERGAIPVDGYGQTADPHIYAIGDVTGRLQLAHAAMREGVIAVENLAGRRKEPIDFHLIPRCIYTAPEAASIGLTEAEAARSHDIKVGKMPFAAIGKALVSGESAGFAKIVADRQTNDLLGIHIYGPHATDLIGEAALARLLDATPWELSQVVHPHPTLTEVLGEAALAVDAEAIHI
ncbi:MAG: dihydrolipoyl dehydrogenase [Sporolactobacillus sp.]|jgi:dihydrolipoamide dehydrogenase|nr:dihydrolipoyl dehydrogenase [Sporolactobacillus sp.]